MLFVVRHVSACLLLVALWCAIGCGSGIRATSSAATTSYPKPSATSVSLAGSATSATLGTTITFNATLTPAVATGTISFYDGSTLLSAVAVSGGAALLSTGSLSAGTHTVAAMYSGSAAYSDSTSNAVGITLTAPSTIAAASVALSDSAALVSYGGPETLTATVSPPSAVGTVTFLDGSTSLGTANVASGLAVFTASSLTAGTHVFTAMYGGAQNSSGSTSNAVTVTVTVFPTAKRTSYTAFGDSITCGYVAAGATTGPPYTIGDASCHAANAYPTYVAAATTLPTQNNGIPADQACDIWVRQIAPQAVSPTSASSPLYSVLIGTNDANVKGPGAYESVFSSCSLASLTWLAIPLESKVLPVAAVNSGWTLASTSTLGSYAVTETAGATLSFTVSTTGGPLYLWHELNDALAGTATYSVDGVLAGTFQTQPAVPIDTQNGTSDSVGATRIGGLAAGQHTVVVTAVAGRVAVMGLGTPSPAAGRPLVLAGQVPLPSLAASGALLASMDSYSADTAAVVTTLAADGLPVVYAPNHVFMQGTAAELTDLLHVTPLGATHLAAAFLAVTP